MHLFVAGVGDHSASVVLFDKSANVLGVGKHQLDGEIGDHAYIVRGCQVEGIGHGDADAGIVDAQRQELVAKRQFSGDQRDRLGIEVALRKRDQRDSCLHGKSRLHALL